MQWVKLHTDILSDDKLMRAARKGAKSLEFLPWLLAFAARANDGGRLTVDGEPADAADIAHHIPGATPAKVAQCMASALACDTLRRASDGALYFPARVRPAIPTALRDAVVERDGGHCQYCGAAELLEIDHVYPWSLGGRHELDNLQVLCRRCNREKGARP